MSWRAAQCAKLRCPHDRPQPPHLLPFPFRLAGSWPPTWSASATWHAELAPPAQQQPSAPSASTQRQHSASRSHSAGRPSRGGSRPASLIVSSLPCIKSLVPIPLRIAVRVHPSLRPGARHGGPEPPPRHRHEGCRRHQLPPHPHPRPAPVPFLLPPLTCFRSLAEAPREGGRRRSGPARPLPSQPLLLQLSRSVCPLLSSPKQHQTTSAATT